MNNVDRALRLLLPVALACAGSLSGQAWLQLPDPPFGGSGQPFDTGSAVCGYADTLCVLKGSYNEFYFYDANSNAWTPGDPLPEIGRSGNPVSAYSGAALSPCTGGVLATKGNNSLEFWAYVADSVHWYQKSDVPAGPSGSAVDSGASMVKVGTDYYLLKGNGTNELYRYDSEYDQWAQMPGMPAGPSGKGVGPGGAMVVTPARTIYALKGNHTSEFFAYIADSALWWRQLRSVPLDSSGLPIGDGGGLAYNGGDTIFCLKGNSTVEFWAYSITGDTWVRKPDLPLGLRRVAAGPGTSLAFANAKLHVLKANHTVEFYRYQLGQGVTEQISSTIQTPGLQVAPNPARDRFRISPSSATFAREVLILDLSGHRVRALSVGPGSQNAVTWDGADDQGRRLPAGVYLVQARVGKRSLRMSLVKMN